MNNNKLMFCYIMLKLKDQIFFPKLLENRFSHSEYFIWTGLEGNGKLPVLFSVHSSSSGGFCTYGKYPENKMVYGVILVTVHYRVDRFGKLGPSF